LEHDGRIIEVHDMIEMMAVRDFLIWRGVVDISSFSGINDG